MKILKYIVLIVIVIIVSLIAYNSWQDHRLNSDENRYEDIKLINAAIINYSQSGMGTPEKFSKSEFDQYNKFRELYNDFSEYKYEKISEDKIKLCTNFATRYNGFTSLGCGLCSNICTRFHESGYYCSECKVDKYCVDYNPCLQP